jgi:nuclear GTP-binding protein
LREWKNADEFLEALARKTGKLLKGGEADMDAVAKMVLNDFLRGRIPWYIPPPKREEKEGETGGKEEGDIDGRKGRLGEMAGLKRKRDDVAATTKKVNTVAKDTADVEADEEDNEEEDSESDDDFAGFEDDEGGVVVNPDAFGNLDDFAKVDSEDEDEELDSDDAGDDAAALGPADEQVSPDDMAEEKEIDPPKKRRRKG